MRVAVLSDTHIPLACKSLPEALLKEIEGVDLIIHAGDLVELSVLNDLVKIAPVEAVSGNMDSLKSGRSLPRKKILELGGFKIGITHGSGAPQNLICCLQQEFANQELDCIIYGHSHLPKIENIDGTIYFNPGSPTDKVIAPYNSYGILEITDKLTPKIVRLKS
ncbi:MAG: metallophosphoesterase family protein [Candidatus Omnitrophota bacterium]